MATYVEHSPCLNKYYPDTQRVANCLPGHNKIRTSRDSVGQGLINAIFGRHVARLRKQLDAAFTDGFLELASMDQPDVLWSASIDPLWDMGSAVPSKNLLKNSSFEINTNQMRTVPDWWYISEYTGTSPNLQTVSIEDNGVIGDKCVKIVGAADSLCVVSQIIPDRNAPSMYYPDNEPIDPNIRAPFKTGQRFVLSWYYKVGAGSLAVDKGKFAIVFTLQDTEENDQVFEYKLPFTATDGWVYGFFKVTLDRDYTTATISCKTEYEAGAIGIPVVYVDAMQLEFGEEATKWEPHLNEKPFYLDKYRFHGPAHITAEFGTRVQHVNAMEDFWYNLPTRASYQDKKCLSEDPTTGTAGYSYEVNSMREIWEVEWILKEHGGVKYICKAGSSPQDIYGWYKLAPFTRQGLYATGYNSFYYTHELTPHALTYYQGRLWAIASGYNGMEWTQYAEGGTELPTKRMYLCVASPDVPWPEPNHLEVDMVLELPQWNMSYNPVRVEFKNEDQQHILISSQYDVYRYRLYYDYFMTDVDKRTAYFREGYSSIGMQPISEVHRIFREVTRV